MSAKLEGFVAQVKKRGRLEMQWSEFRNTHFSEADEQFARATVLRWFAERGIHGTIEAHHLGWRDVEVLVLEQMGDHP